MPWTPDATKLLCHFSVPSVRTWGSKTDKAFKADLVEAAKTAGIKDCASGKFAFVIDACIDEQYKGKKGQEADVENVPKLVVDSFVGVLYPDDNVNHVQAVHVTGCWAKEPKTEIWVYEYP